MLWFDLHCGVSGDMLLGALIGLGAPVDELNALLRSLPDDLQVQVTQGNSRGFGGLKARVVSSRALQPYWPAGAEAASGTDIRSPESHCEHQQGYNPGSDNTDSQQDHNHFDHHHHHDRLVHHCEYDHGHGHSEHLHHHDHEHRTLAHVRALLDASTFPREVVDTALQAFELLAQAEGQAHGLDPERVHFHEVGAIDSIADLVGCCWAWHRLGCPAVKGNALNLGGGTVQCAHGSLAVPAPAVGLLVQGMAVESTGSVEKTTPTGAVLLRIFGLEQGPMPSGQLRDRVCSLGDRDTGEFNGLTAYRIDVLQDESDDRIIQMDCWVDDMNPQDWPPLFDALRDAGATEWFLSQGLGKKGRPACALTVICKPQVQETVAAALFTHSTTLGVRIDSRRRLVCSRQEHCLDLQGYPLRVKVACWQGKEVNRSYEYEDLRRIADTLGLPTAQVRALAEGADHLL